MEEGGGSRRMRAERGRHSFVWLGNKCLDGPSRSVKHLWYERENCSFLYSHSLSFLILPSSLSLFLPPSPPSLLLSSLLSLCRIILKKKKGPSRTGAVMLSSLVLMLFIFLSWCSGSLELTERFCRIETL